MGKVVDNRPEWTGKLGRYKTEDIELVETVGNDSDFVIRLKNGDDHYYRCSCSITFENGFLLII